MKLLLVVALLALIKGSYATLLIKGPSQPVLEGDSVTLECLYSDSERNTSQVHIEVFNKYAQRWRPAFEPGRLWCYSEGARYWKSGPVLKISYMPRFIEGPYRCVSNAENVTAPDNSSEPLTLKVHYMGELSLSREGYSRYLSVPEELKVHPGDDVVLTCSASSSEEPSYFWHKEGSDWILPSSTLTLRKASVTDGGEYTCMAEHPSVESLNKKRSVRISVLPEDAPWFESSNGRLILMTSAAGVALLVFILSMSVFLCRRAKQTNTSKGPIDDHSQKKPIYKGSSESLPSASGDTQPLV